MEIIIAGAGLSGAWRSPRRSCCRLPRPLPAGRRSSPLVRQGRAGAGRDRSLDRLLCGAHLGYGWGKKIWVDNYPSMTARSTPSLMCRASWAACSSATTTASIGWCSGSRRLQLERRQQHRFRLLFVWQPVVRLADRLVRRLAGRLGVVYGPALLHQGRRRLGGRPLQQSRDLLRFAADHSGGITADCGNTYSPIEPARLAGRRRLRGLFARDWSVKVKYNYMDLGSRQRALRGRDGGYFTGEIHEKVQLV